MNRAVARALQILSWISGAAVALSLAIAHSASATPILLGTTTDATGIQGLVVDGTSYNVTFISATYNQVYGSSTPTFENNLNGATDAMTALTAALQSLQVTVLTGNSPGVQSAVIAYGPEADDQFLAQQSVFGIDGSYWSNLDETEINADSTYTHNDIAVFVPEPDALSLFGAGLAGLGMLRRKRPATGA
jgi:hypothetical protein